MDHKRILSLERNVKRIMDHLSLEYEEFCKGYGCVRKADDECAWCGDGVCNICKSKITPNFPTASYESYWAAATFTACSDACVTYMELWEKKRPMFEWARLDTEEQERERKELADEVVRVQVEKISGSR